MEALRLEIERRMRDALARLAAGDDLPPAQGLRLEGLCEAAVLLGLASPEELDGLLDTACRDTNGRGLGDLLGPRWRELHAFPELPLFMQRAPVSPSTGS